MADQPQEPAKKIEDVSEVKQYSLQAHETQFLRYLRQHQEAVFAGYLSTIAGSRLAYAVTPNTKFELTGDMTVMKLSELAPPPQQTQQAPAEGGAAVTPPTQ